MRLLLDTHAFLWFVLDDPKLSPVAKTLIGDSENVAVVSAASCWEIALKISLGKYSLPGSFREFFNRQLQENDFEYLPVTIDHSAAITVMPFHHRDPFDRMLVAQALTEPAAIVSKDEALDAYGVDRRW